MGVTAAGGVGLAVAAMRRRAKVMQVIGDRDDVAIGVRVEVLSALSLVPRALDDVIQVRNHAGRDECLAVVVEVDTPRIARAVGEHFELMSASDDTARRRS